MRVQCPSCDTRLRVTLPDDDTRVECPKCGTLFRPRDPNTDTLYFDARESPPNNSINNYNRIRIDGLTGRTRLERPEIGQPQTP